MGDIRTPVPVKLFCGILAAEAGLLPAARRALADAYGALDHASEPLPFEFTDYYGPEMGPRLLRQFVSFRNPIAPHRIAEIKRHTHALERDFAVERSGALCRRVNLDPGYLTPAKLVLATTKDFAHRICLDDGIYAEVTLNFDRYGCRFHPWTYADFRSEPCTRFFAALRQEFMEQQKRAGPGDAAVA